MVEYNIDKSERRHWIREIKKIAIILKELPQCSKVFKFCVKKQNLKNMSNLYKTQKVVKWLSFIKRTYIEESIEDEYLRNIVESFVGHVNFNIKNDLI